ncbi:PREDICTED: jacalin-related lectin 44-like [Camelina sativa]|uniref:Jacalin-related lectin 44-like n=1 Tax=Camelina sativa TaxID=90675 RepID=A0ABM0X5Q2_CAMSA|nr:PREDICTED: jacalin-related lectin 44-like [Camelina sativa]
MTERLAARGIMVNKYNWDDGPDHDDVTKIYVGLGEKGIRYIYCDYVKSGIQKEGSFHGMMYRCCTCIQMFEIDHLRNEHLESVDSYYADPVGITALQFKTNFRTSELFGFEEKGTKFTLAVAGKKIIGLHGSALVHVHSLGAYLTWITPIRLDEKGGKGGKEWDDGSDHDNVSKIHVRGGFDYVKDRKVLENGSTHGVSSRGFTQTKKEETATKPPQAEKKPTAADGGAMTMMESKVVHHRFEGHQTGQGFQTANTINYVVCVICYFCCFMFQSITRVVVFLVLRNQLSHFPHFLVRRSCDSITLFCSAI